MNPIILPEELIKSFYTAFNNRDYATMQQCYHPNATFSDPAFGKLDSAQVKAMWQMLLTASKDIRVAFNEVKTHGDKGSCRWDAYYSFSQTGRQVHNIIYANFTFKDGLILEHHDHFDFWRWSRMALGTPGLLLGWTPFFHKKVSTAARQKLAKYMSKP